MRVLDFRSVRNLVAIAFMVGLDGSALAAESLTTASAQAEAIRRHPELGKAGTEFNKAFVERVKRLRTEKPDLFKDPAWPLKVADEVAQALSSRQALAPQNTNETPKEASVTSWAHDEVRLLLPKTDKTQFSTRHRVQVQTEYLVLTPQHDVVLLLQGRFAADDGSNQPRKVVLKLRGADSRPVGTTKANDFMGFSYDTAFLPSPDGGAFVVGATTRGTNRPGVRFVKVGSEGKVSWTQQHEGVKFEKMLRVSTMGDVWTAVHKQAEPGSNGRVDSSTYDTTLLGHCGKDGTLLTTKSNLAAPDISDTPAQFGDGRDDTMLLLQHQAVATKATWLLHSLSSQDGIFSFRREIMITRRILC